MAVFAQMNSESLKTSPELPLLAEFVEELGKAMEDVMTATRSAEQSEIITELMRKKAVSSISANFFEVVLPEQVAQELLHSEHLQDWLIAACGEDTGQEALAEVKAMCYMTLNRALAPAESLLPVVHVADPNAMATGACMGISSISIINGFKAYQGVFKEQADVDLEEVRIDDGMITEVLRARECEKVRRRGYMCAQCRAAQNRWAVRICRYKKQANALHTKEAASHSSQSLVLSE